MNGIATKKLEIDLPNWAVSDEEMEAALLPSGWLREYVDYARGVTDAPLAYHYATGVSTLLQAISHTDIRVYLTEKDYASHAGRCNQISTPLWTALIGLSGDRKSFAMDLGLSILRRAVGHDVLLPIDGSIEAWTDYLVKKPNIILHREELSFLFSQSRKSYMEGLKDWLLTLHSGQRYDRTTRRKKRIRNEKGEEQETDDNEHIIVERPRVSVFGAIPPEVFRTKSERLDWSSGFFARFMFVPAIRTTHREAPLRHIGTEGKLAGDLQALHRAMIKNEAAIKIPPRTARIISDWILEEIEPLRGQINDRVYSHFTRYLDLGYRLTAANAASCWRSPEQAVLATPTHAKAAREALGAFKEAMTYMFAEAVKSTERSFDDDVFEHFRKHRSDWLTLDSLDDTFPDHSRRKLASWCRAMYDDGRLRQKKLPPKGQKTGRKRLSYQIA